MPRPQDTHYNQPPVDGWDMIINARQTDAHPSLATGVYPTGVADGTNTVACSTGGALGTGMNADIYTPAVET